jgi:hypothetical protein
MTLQQELFQKPNQKKNGTKLHIDLENVAEKLAISFTEPELIPAKYKKTSKKAKSKEDSKIQQKFNETIDAWHIVVKTILENVESPQAWRFINTNPKIDKSINRLTDCKDFLDFFDYFARRRDKDFCDDNELGLLSLLLMAFQRKIERIISLNTQ